MAGNLDSPSVIWNVGDTTGRNVAGASTAIPVGPVQVTAGTANPPTDAPAGAPIYHKTDDDDIYIWTGSAWEGPYNKGT